MSSSVSLDGASFAWAMPMVETCVIEIDLMEAVRLKTFEVFAKVQEARPAHRSTLINKELGYDTLVELGDHTDPIKVRNCVNSARPNSELFKRFSRGFLSNLRTGVDQLLLFSSASRQARLETSVGLSSNPGIFLVAGLTYLDEKYKEGFQRCELEFSFLEVREGVFFDLLGATGEPMVLGGEHWARTATFSQFIRLFKVALFNNKDRDFRSQEPNHCSTTFIMQVRSSLYEQDQLLRSQQTVLVDLEPQCLKDSQPKPLQREKTTGRSLLDLLLADLHNANPNHRPQHYHLLEDNQLLTFLRPFLERSPEAVPSRQEALPLVRAQVTVVVALSADREAFPSELAHLSTVQAAVGESWVAKVLPKWRPARQLQLSLVEERLSSILGSVGSRSYGSLRAFSVGKAELCGQARRCRGVFRQLRRCLAGAVRQKLQVQLMRSQLLAYEVGLVGGCIKSDHFKDFYLAKSHLQLDRQVAIKTQPVKTELKARGQLLQQASRKFAALKHKQQNLRLDLTSTKENSTHTQTKFRRITLTHQDPLLELQALSSQLCHYLHGIWDAFLQGQERTIAHTLQLEDSLRNTEDAVNRLLDAFVHDLQALQEDEVGFEQEVGGQAGEAGLFRSLNFLGLIGPRKTQDHYEAGRRLVVREPVRPKRNAVSCQKLPALPVPLRIRGQLRLSDLLSRPVSQALVSPDCGQS